MKIVLTFALLVTNIISYAQPTIEWQKCLGGTDGDYYARSIQQTTDGGFIVAGYTSSNDGDVTGNHGSGDCWIVKLSNTGSIQWQKCLGGTGVDEANSIQQTTDGGYIVAGYSSSTNGDVTGNHGGDDCWVVKLNSSGVIVWQKCLGGTGNEGANSIQQTTDGGYIVAGYSNLTNGDVTGNHGVNDYWIVKLSNTGSIQWQKCLGGTLSERAYSIQQATDGGYIIAGWSFSNDGDVTGYHGFNGEDYWVVKLNSSGVIVWQKCLGGTGGDEAYYIQKTSDGGYVVAGYSSSNDGDASGNHGDYDYWIVKLSNTGSIQWQKSYGGSWEEDGLYNCIQQTTDGGYIVSGATYSSDGDVTGYHGQYDYWIVKLNNTGSIQWQKCLGGTGFDGATSIQQTTDGGYIVGGYTTSNDGDVTGNHGGYDYWIVKLSAGSDVNEINSTISNLSIIPNPVSSISEISFSIKQAEKISINIYDISGRIVKNIYDGILTSGKHQFNLDVNGEHKIENGIYVLAISGEEFLQTSKLIITKGL